MVRVKAKRKKNLRVFGELGIVETEERKVSSTWNESEKGAIFVGYSNKFSTYRFLIEGEIHLECDAVFIDKMNTGEQVRVPQDIDDGIWLSSDINTVSLGSRGDCSDQHQE